MLLCIGMLSGCLKNGLFFSQSTNYKIVGIDGDKDARNYLEKILNERVADNIDYDENSDDFKRAEIARAETIASDLLKSLKAKGYYDAEVNYVDDADAPLSGTYQINAGEIYTISTLNISPPDKQDLFNFNIVNEGDVLDALLVLNAQNRFYEALQKDQCYFSLDVQHSVILDEDNKTATLEYDVIIGPSAIFGEAIFEGQENVEPSYLKKIVPWKAGDCFRQEKIRDLRTKLLETGLFVRAETILPDVPDDDNTVPVTIALKERVHRSVKAGLSYYTDEGAGITLGWEHRNILGSGEKLEAELSVNQINQSLDLSFIKPFFLRKDQSLEIINALRQQDTDAFDETAFDIGLNIKRKFHKRLTSVTGVQLSMSEIEGEDDKTTYGLLSFPNSLIFDNRNDPLDPVKGWLLRARIEPFYDVLGESDPFTKLDFGARTYINLSDNNDLVLALRANVGSIVGSGTSNIPATERYYAGGGGSIRGYGFQEVGPSDDDGDPTGGRSVATGSTEIRYKFNDTIGGVAFVDGGSVSESASPDFNNLSFGAGLGVRYYTDFGPLRFDVAVPINQKNDLDQNYQFYISIGQAF